MGVAKDVASQVAWRIRPQDTVELSELKILAGKYIASMEGSRLRVTAMYRVGVPEIAEDPRTDYSAAMKTALQQQRMKGLFEGLRRAGVPFLYAVLMDQADQQEGSPPVLEFDLIVGTWADGKKKDEVELTNSVEQRASVLSATLSVALPNASVDRLLRADLAGFVKRLLFPGGQALPQEGPPALGAALCQFSEMSPLSAGLRQSPEFYVPNAVESGKDCILLGTVVSGGREFHDLSLQLDDLRRHVSVLGMTGSGKSTTTATIVRQASEQGLPALVLDWHNEYSGLVSRVGGKVVSPGKDDFSLNPLEVAPGTDPVEHLAMVSDIFSDIYHFTHPQAYMFRNALQKQLGESGSAEAPSISALVKTIESYPLRSAYDNETKVALLRRLVPLTQGQSGKALGGSAKLGLDELLATTVCVELGHMRDIQSRAVFSDVVLKMVYEEKVRRRSGLDHLTVVEEARNLVPARRVEDPPSVGERMVSELRKFGEAMLFVAQFPTHVASEVVKNSGTKVVHRLAWPDDVSLVGDSLGLGPKQREHLTRLAPGEAVVGVTRIAKPVLVRVKADPTESHERRDLSLAPEA